jgi:anaphase-promoting complex subunit 8
VPRLRGKAGETNALRDWYKREKRLKLSSLAHVFLELDKNRPEVCCLVGGLSLILPSFLPPIYTNILTISHLGNHYSIRAEHEKALKYFRRATQLDRTYLSTWTLVGHEYVEMKNSYAAIEAYTKAVGESFSVSIV